MISAFASLHASALTLICDPSTDKRPANPAKSIEMLKKEPKVRPFMTIIYIDEKNERARLELADTIRKGALFATQDAYLFKFKTELVLNQYEINRVDGSYKLSLGSDSTPLKIIQNGKCAPLPEVKTMF